MSLRTSDGNLVVATASCHVRSRSGACGLEFGCHRTHRVDQDGPATQDFPRTPPYAKYVPDATTGYGSHLSIPGLNAASTTGLLGLPSGTHRTAHRTNGSRAPHHTLGSVVSRAVRAARTYASRIRDVEAIDGDPSPSVPRVARRRAARPDCLALRSWTGCPTSERPAQWLNGTNG